MNYKKGLLLLPVIFLFTFYFWPDTQLHEGLKVDKLVVYKSKREMYAFANNILVKKYKIALGGNPKGHKQFEGDNKTPEGIYYINDRNPNSDYHKNLGVSYPNEKDILFAQKQNKAAGGDIKVHGLPNGIGFIGKFHRFTDWTAGCIAITNSEIDELYQAVIPNAIIEIRP